MKRFLIIFGAASFTLLILLSIIVFTNDSSFLSSNLEQLVSYVSEISHKEEETIVKNTENTSSEIDSTQLPQESASDDTLPENSEASEEEENNKNDEINENALFRLSKKGQNVIVIMLDRGMGEYLPYIIKEHPELCEKFSGFTYYSNTISFGSNTNFAISALVGGYEYTPVELNKRSGEKLVTKHNEALKVLPVLFSNHGYEVTVCDPVYANYKWTPDLSIYKEYPNIHAYNTKGKYASDGTKTYDKSQYPGQETDGKSKAQGISSDFMASYNVLCSLPNLTQITNQKKNTYLFLSNDVTHYPILLKEPECVPAEEVDNTQYDAEHTERFTINGRTLRLYNDVLMAHYQTNIAALARLGDWFDFMREHDVYDNTRIILVSDHGRGFGHFPEFIYKNSSDSLKKLDWYYPLLMVKDFGSTGFTTSDAFMTNADVPSLAVSGVIDDPVNPFTGKKITNAEKFAHDQYLIISYTWKTSENNGNTFLPARWARVRDNIWDQNNWQFYDTETVLDQYRFPND